jgi:2-polyprenyl-3-methyl-5-hydroxy-6-metoxy-1,4-benzoquinol methylase
VIGFEEPPRADSDQPVDAQPLDHNQPRVLGRHLAPETDARAPALSVLDLATGTGLLAGAFAERGHAVAGPDFADNLLNRAAPE